MKLLLAAGRVALANGQDDWIARQPLHRVLAAAYAEAGDFARAIQTGELAVKIALENNQTREADAVDGF